MNLFDNTNKSEVKSEKPSKNVELSEFKPRKKKEEVVKKKEEVKARKLTGEEQELVKKGRPIINDWSRGVPPPKGSIRWIDGKYVTI
jgi:hypothetical protein